MGSERYKISVIGAGNGGQAMAGHLAIMGHEVVLYNRTMDKISAIAAKGFICLKEAITGTGKLKYITDNLEQAVRSSEILMITTTADAHGELAKKIAPYLRDGQMIVLNPGRTGGALEFRRVFQDFNLKARVYIAECQSLVYACRIETCGVVRIIGIKDRVLFSTLPSSDIDKVSGKLCGIYPCMSPVENVLITSLENIGAIFHPAIVWFNMAAIERAQPFYFYNDITAHISSFLLKLDSERLSLGKAFGIALHSAEEWISFAYKNIEGDRLYSRMKNNPAYSQILAPDTIQSRLLLEDIPTGILPMIELGKIVSLEMPLMNAIFQIGQALLGKNFLFTGRTLDRLGLENKTLEEVYKEL